MGFEAGDVLEAYTIEKQLSDIGGMAKIYLAYETERPERRLVLKVQITGAKESLMFQDLLREEAALLKTLRHPNIVRILPMRFNDNHGGRKVSFVAKAAALPDMPWYYAMEFLGDYSLSKHISQFPDSLRIIEADGPPAAGIYSVDWSLELFYQILIAVEFMHHNGMAHGDLKPDNILFRQTPSAQTVPQPVLIDFGSACLFNRMRQLTASIEYSPPEVMKAVENNLGLDEIGRIDAEKIDVWSLGVILFEILAGRKMKPAKGLGILRKTLIRPKDKKIGRYRPDVHGSIDKLLQIMLSDDPDDRPEVSQVITAIEEKIYSIRPPRIDNRS